MIAKERPTIGVRVHLSNLFREGMTDFFEGFDKTPSWLQDTPAHVEAYRQGREFARRIEAGELTFEREKKNE